MIYRARVQVCNHSLVLLLCFFVLLCIEFFTSHNNHTQFFLQGQEQSSLGLKFRWQGLPPESSARHVVLTYFTLGGDGVPKTRSGRQNRSSEQPERLQGKILSIPRYGTTQGRLLGVCVGFFRRLPSFSLGIYSFTSPHRRST